MTLRFARRPDAVSSTGGFGSTIVGKGQLAKSASIIAQAQDSGTGSGGSGSNPLYPAGLPGVVDTNGLASHRAEQASKVDDLP
jgi:hypothetical protein